MKSLCSSQGIIHQTQTKLHLSVDISSFWQIDYFQFKGEVFLGFKDEGKGFIYTDYTGTPVFTKEITNGQGESERTAYHPEALGVKIITLDEEGQVPDNAQFETVRQTDSVIMPVFGGRQTHVAFLETNEPIKGLTERIGRAIKHRGGLTYYSLGGGQRFWSETDVQNNYSTSKDSMIELLEAREIHKKKIMAEEATRREAEAQPPTEEVGPDSDQSDES
ncbi:hypothetical protein ACFLZ6_00675 [Nanoarchaeota archaeon]